MFQRQNNELIAAVLRLPVLGTLIAVLRERLMNRSPSSPGKWISHVNRLCVLSRACSTSPACRPAASRESRAAFARVGSQATAAAIKQSLLLLHNLLLYSTEKSTQLRK